MRGAAYIGMVVLAMLRAAFVAPDVSFVPEAPSASAALSARRGPGPRHHRLVPVAPGRDDATDDDELAAADDEPDDELILPTDPGEAAAPPRHLPAPPAGPPARSRLVDLRIDRPPRA